MKLSILIPTTPDREHFLTRLKGQFYEQIGDVIPANFNRTFQEGMYAYSNNDIEFIYFKDNKEDSIGYKRNKLLEMALGDYVAFIDDDDRIGENYFKHALAGISYGVDACGLTGIITEDGINPKKFVHSYRFDSWYEKDNVYYRNTNHLNVVKRSIAIRMNFPEINNGEDHSYSKQLLNSGLIKTEYWDENEIIYLYDFRSRK